MKIVVSPDQVAHLWAHQSQETARNSGSTFFFDGNSIYSYGRHFCIAKHVTNESGKSAVLFTTRGYSVSTSKHINIVRNASNHLEKIYCPDPGVGTFGNLEAFTKNIKSALVGLQKAKKPIKYIHEAECILEQAKKYAEFMEILVPSIMTELLEVAKSGDYKIHLAKERERYVAELKARNEQIMKEARKQLAKWRKGENTRLHIRADDRDYLRIGNKGRIETSQGIEIPVELAKRLYKNIIKIIKSGGCSSSESCDFKILDYSVNEINNKFIHVGCHKIDIKEINKMAKQIGII